MKLWWLAFLPVVLAGCAGAPAGGRESAQLPVSQQIVEGDAPRQRAKAHTDLGMLYLRDGRLNVALDEARVAIESDSSYPLSYNLMGLVHMYLKEDGAAEQAFGQALRLAPTDPEVNNNYGWFLCQTGRERASLAYFDTASKSQLYATPTKPLTNGGFCALAIKDDKTAEQFFQRALRADSANSDAQFALAGICYRAGRLIEARDRLADIHRVTEPNAQTAWLALRVERRLGDREAEARYATVLRRSFADSPEYQLLRQGRFE